MDDAAAKSDPQVRDVIPEIIRRAREQNLSIDLPRQFPIHLSLPMYADRISDTKHRQEGPPSLLSHIAYMIGRDADDEVNRDDLRAWLKVYPWLVILDGLDEVPASGERSAVIEAINGFLSEIAGAGADAMVIVTSQPQGYNNDLDERYWARWQLADLDLELAVKYAEALSLAQYPLDRDRRNRTLSALKRAMEHPATARLMVSPLQVTILHIIIDGGGSAPVGRWALFNEYFQILKKREKSKGGPIQAVLEKNWDHIDPVHYQAGLVLQTESEAAGAAGAHFTLKRLKSLIKAFLRSIDYSKHETELRADELGNLAVNRLVLMSMRQQGRTEAEGLITFDVRSLQEFMAAAELTTETERAPTLGDSDNSSKMEETHTDLRGRSLASLLLDCCEQVLFRDRTLSSSLCLGSNTKDP